MAIVKEERIGDQRLILGDCLEVMPGLDTFDAVVTDPPYGIGEGGDKNRSRGKVAPVGKYKSDKWDSTTADVQIKLAIQMSKSAIVFGGNYYDLPPTPCWLVWDKQNGSNDFADCELAWTNLTKAVRRIYWRWHGMIRKGSDIRQHPTQKPLGVMEWCINHLPDTAQTILDPFMGSGTTLVACQKLGRAGTGIELDPDYFHIACKRVDEATRQPDLFVEPAPKPTQEVLL
mgnify:CR=1 FL=1|tara:strand:+ start:267 stop:956 length:690 start_codon:yes stop_codon:yes gene_type:complete